MSQLVYIDQVKPFQLPTGYPTTIVSDQNHVISDVFSGGTTDSTASTEIFLELKKTIGHLLRK